MTGLTALIIQNRGEDVKANVGGPSKDSGKYTGWIELYNDGVFHAPLINTEAIYDTEKEALTAMENLITEVRGMKL